MYERSSILMKPDASRESTWHVCMQACMCGCMNACIVAVDLEEELLKVGQHARHLLVAQVLAFTGRLLYSACYDIFSPLVLILPIEQSGHRLAERA